MHTQYTSQKNFVRTTIARHVLQIAILNLHNNLKLLYTEAFTDRKLWPTASFDTEKLSHTQWQQKLQRLTTSLSHHSPESPLPRVTTSLSHHFSKSPLLCDHFVFRLPPQNTPHPTFIQNSHHAQRVTNPHVSTHVARKHGNVMRSATTDAKTL